MPIIVQKYGGSSLATSAHVQQVAALIAKRLKTGIKLCIVVSAMGKNTNELLALAHEISKNPVRRELDMLLSCGERASMALLAMALHELGIPSISLTGSQSGIITDDVHSGAQILEVRPTRIQEGLEQGKVVIVAGFQGVSLKREITTLGRGGSDTTAVALAAALGAEACEIYSDVAGVYSADPRVITDPKHIEQLSYDEMLELASSGAKVLNAEAVQFAKLKNIQIKARKTGEPNQETVIGASESPAGPVAITAQEKLFCFKYDSLQALGELLKALEKLFIKPNQILGTQRGYCLIAPEDAHGLSKLEPLPGISQLADCASVSLIGNNLGSNMQVFNQVHLLGIISSKLRLCFFVKPSEVHSLVRALYLENIK
ncbi:MAG: aspartate kinase [Myxococcaceae bacterium]